MGELTVVACNIPNRVYGEAMVSGLEMFSHDEHVLFILVPDDWESC